VPGPRDGGNPAYLQTLIPAFIFACNFNVLAEGHEKQAEAGMAEQTEMAESPAFLALSKDARKLLGAIAKAINAGNGENAQMPYDDLDAMVNRRSIPASLKALVALGSR
jgi:hypothetical protein